MNPYIEYFSVLFDADRAPLSINHLADCILINELLMRIPSFPRATLEINPTNFVHIFANVKETYKKIQEYWNEFLGREISCEEIDLVDIAHNKNEKQIIKIINLVIQSLVMSSEREYFIQKILEVSSASQQYFMNLVEATLEQRKTFSPRKQREQRLYDKMIELDHQNEHLQNVISEICQEKEEVESRLKQAMEKLKEKDEQIFRLHESMSDIVQTPQKKPQSSVYFDTQQKSSQFIEKLKQKIIQMTKQNEIQLIEHRQQIEFYHQNMHRLEFLQNQVEMYRVKFQGNREAIEGHEELNKKYAELKLTSIENEQKINDLSRKLNSKNKKLHELEEKLIERELELERKNVNIEKMRQVSVSKYNCDDQFEGLTLQRTLSEHCPEVVNSQAEFLYESNKKLREEMERSNTTIKQLEAELLKLRKQFQVRESLELENRKLVAIIEQQSEQNQQETDLILGCLHEIRLRFMNEMKPKLIMRKKRTNEQLRITSKQIPTSLQRIQQVPI